MPQLGLDPMYNIFEGTARHFMHVILENGILARSAMYIVEKRTTAISSPYDVGHLPLKIASKFAGFKADQWCYWIIIFSEIALIWLIPQSYYNCCQKYAKACKLVCAHAFTKMKITEADRLLQEFSEEFCRLYLHTEHAPTLALDRMYAGLWAHLCILVLSL